MLRSKIIEHFRTQIDPHVAAGGNRILILSGFPAEMNESLSADYKANLDTFNRELAKSDYDKTWFSKTFAELSKEKSHHYISHQEYAHIIEYIDPSFFTDRTILIQDNIRRLYPLPSGLFLENDLQSGSDKRPDDLPLHQIEQIKVADKYFYVVGDFPGVGETVNIFNDQKEIDEVSEADEDIRIIDATTDKYAVDLFVNELLTEEASAGKAAIKFYIKNPLSAGLKSSLEQLNSLLGEFDSEILFLLEEAIEEEYEVSEEAKQTIRLYWGEGADFRKLRVYKSPNTSRRVSEISQGQIVDIIIDEYKRSKKGNEARDLFLTAPTGAGKSLLFQLPAFHISSQGDVTIVVSPLIALMKDQVSAIVKDRGFEKVAYLNSELSLNEREQLIEDCKEGRLDIIYLSPELLLSYDIRHFIGERNLGLIVIDEAHLITTWGRDFRVDYWFLGNHIRKMRKFHDLKFPLVAVTATAIYGGANDMVFDSIDSLAMQNPHLYIGEVRRGDIEFVVNNYEGFDKGYDKKKIKQTSKFIMDISGQTKFKTLVYAPYTKHVNQIIDTLKAEGLDVASGYYGKLDQDRKQYAYEQFLNGEKQVMVATKAFGMGVDISNIQVVYHHAPSGLLPDYVQEVGRLARDPKLKGYATLNYSTQDQRYTKQLHGMSALRQGQLREVLKKVYSAYLVNKSRNILLSVDDFAYIFEDAFDLDQKVLTSLMMIEKDYLNKYRFNVLIARPKKLFVKVYASITKGSYSKVERKYTRSMRVVQTKKSGDLVVEMDLDTMWMNHFQDKSFPMLKRAYYMNKLLEKDRVEVVPQLKVIFDLNVSLAESENKLQHGLRAVRSSLAAVQNGYFEEKDIIGPLTTSLNDADTALKLAKFILSTYSGRMTAPGRVEDNAAIQRRTVDGKTTYRVIGGGRYLREIEQLERLFNIMFIQPQEQQVERFITIKDNSSARYSRLGYVIEVFGLGTFEIKGGENPMVFIRVNDPSKLEYDSRSYYENTILKKTLDRHYLSNRIFDHFFLKQFSNEERWAFIEDFFLGEDIDTLEDKFPGTEPIPIDLISKLVSQGDEAHSDDRQYDRSNPLSFPPNTEKWYDNENLLTLNINGKDRTLKVTQWLVEDPVAFDKARHEVGFKISKEVFDFLRLKLKKRHPEYFKEAAGLSANIKFPGYDSPVQARTVYQSEPVKFYKWWVRNEEEVNITFKEKIELFLKVKNHEPKVLTAEHAKLIS